MAKRNTAVEGNGREEYLRDRDRRCPAAGNLEEEVEA